MKTINLFALVIAFAAAATIASAQTSFTITVGPSPVSITTTTTSSIVTVKEQNANPNSYYITDSHVGPSQFLVPAGSPYTFSQGGGYASGTVIGTIQMASNVTTQFLVTQTGTGGSPAKILVQPTTCPASLSVTAINVDGSLVCSGGSGGSVTNVTGTMNQIDVATGTTTPVISIDPGFIGSPANGLQFNNAGPTLGAVTPPATPGIFNCGYTVPSTSSVAPTCPQQGSLSRSINAGNYTTANTVLFSDNLFGLTIDAATAAAVTLSLPTPTTLNNASFAFPVTNGSPIASSIVPVTWTINGLPSFTIPPAAPTTQAATYAFTTVENPLSKFGNFSVAGSGYAVTQVPSGGVVESTTRNAYNAAFYTGLAWASNQCSTSTVLVLGGGSGQNFLSSVVRMSSSAATWYGVDVDGPTATSSRQVQFLAIVAGTQHVLSTIAGGITVNVGDTLGVCVTTSGSSNVLTAFHNGTQIGTFTDSTYAASIVGGSPGFAFYVQSAAVTDLQLSAWSATGSIVGVPPVRCVFGIDPFNSTNWLGNCGASFSATGQNIASGYGTAANCSSSASPAVCGSAAAGSVSVPTGTDPTLVVDTSAVTPTSQIILQIDESLGAKLNVTCNSTLSSLGTPLVTTRIAGTSFTIEMDSTVATNPVCLNYTVVN